MRDGTIAGVSGTQTSSEPISLQGREGLQFTASMQNGEVTYLARAYADGDTVYQVIVVTAGEVRSTIRGSLPSSTRSGSRLTSDLTRSRESNG